MTRCVAIRFRLCWRHSLSVLTWSLQKGPEGEITRETGSRGWKEGPREDRERASWQRKAEENSRFEIAVQRMTQSAEGGCEKTEVGQRRESTEVRKTTAKTYWPTEAGLTNARRCQHCKWLVRISFEYTLTLAHRMHSVTDFPFLVLGVDPSPCLFVCSVPPPSQLCFAYL